MASLLTDVMDSSFGGYDCPIVGYRGSDPPLENDACHGVDLFALFDPATVHSSPTENFGFDHVILGQDPACTGFLLESNDILGYDITAPDVSSLDGNSEFDLESLVAETRLPPPLVRMDTQPATSVSATLADFSFSSWKIPCEASAPGSPDSGFYSVESPCSTSISEDEPSPCATPAPAAIAKANVTPEFHVSAEDIQYLESLLEESANSDAPATQQLGSQSLASVILEPCAKLPIKTTSRHKTSSRPNKSLTTAEKKERKRAQNKNAATRYREKRRAEARVVSEEQSVMEDKNRDLKDKVTLLTREIQYMKELLIEVYKTKGLVE